MNIKLIDAALAAYEKDMTEGDKTRMSYFREIWGIMDGASAQIEPGAAADVTPEQAINLMRNGRPVFELYPVAIDEDLFTEIVCQIIACMQKNGVLMEGIQEDFEKANWQRLAKASGLQTACLDPNQYVEGLLKLFTDDGMGEEAAHAAMLSFALALRAMLSPSAEAVSRVIAKSDAHDVHVRHCPACGGQAAAARVGQTASIREGRGKELWCAQCGPTWDFDRVPCPRCGTQSQQSLHYYNIEGDDRHRLQTCDECGGYVRTVYQDDSLIPFAFEVEDALMARLDLVAYQMMAKQAAAQQGE